MEMNVNVYYIYCDTFYRNIFQIDELFELYQFDAAIM